MQPPPLDYDVSGWARTGAVRVRVGLFGITILEEQLQSQDGTVKWRRCIAGDTLILLGRSDGQGVG